MERARCHSIVRPVLREIDRRRHPRAPTLYHLVMHAEERKRIVSVEDISLGGVAVFSVEPPSPGTTVLLAFPKQETGSGKMVRVTGRIIRIAGTGVAGIMFDPGQERTVKGILRFLPALRMPKPSPMAASRRRAKTRVKARRKLR